MSTASTVAARALDRLLRTTGEAVTHRAASTTTETPVDALVLEDRDRFSSGASKIKRFVVRQSDLTAPAPGDSIIYGGSEYRIEELTDLTGVGWEMRGSLPRVQA